MAGPARIRLYHAKHWTLEESVPRDVLERVSDQDAAHLSSEDLVEIADKINRDPEDLIVVQTTEAPSLRIRNEVKAKEEVDDYTELSIPEGYARDPIEFAHLIQAITQRHAAERHVEAVSGTDPVLTRKIAAALDADEIPWKKRKLRFLDAEFIQTQVMLASGLIVLGLLLPQLRTSVGRDFFSDAMFKTATRPLAADIIALSESSTAIVNTWTVLGGAAGNELAVDGFARAQATYAHTAATQTSTLQRTFTHSAAAGAGTARTIRKVGIFGQASGGAVPGAADSGILVFAMDEPNPPTLTGTDSLNQTITLDFGAI